MIRQLFSFNGGVKPDSHKDESARVAIRPAPLPPVLTVPLRQNARARGRATVKAGERVRKGQIIAVADGILGTATHAPTSGVVREITEETAQQVRIARLIDVQSDHWIGRSPTGVLEDFQALRIIYTAVCDAPTHPEVLDVDGTTMSASWVPERRWRSLPWTSGARSLLDRYLDQVSLA